MSPTNERYGAPAAFGFSPGGRQPALAFSAAGGGAMEGGFDGNGRKGAPELRVLSVYERRKSHYRRVVWAAMVLSVAAHWLLFEFSPTVTTPVQSYRASELRAIEIPPQVEIPAAPAAVARPAMPVIATTDVPEDLTIAITTFEHNRPEVVVPRPVVEEAKQEIRAEPTFTPYTVAPLLKNREEAAQAILANYPRSLKAAGVGGEVMMWFFIDKTGTVLESRVAKGSGFAEMDEAAMKVADILDFTPAMNRDVAVPVWVQVPIYFSVVTRR